MEELIFAMKICKHVKSNAITITNDLSTIGVGAGQTSRVDSVRIAVDNMQNMRQKFYGSVYAATDGFFPFVDDITKLKDSGILHIIAPLGSKNDSTIIEFCNAHNICFVSINTRMFSH